MITIRLETNYLIGILVWARRTKFVFKLVKWQILVVKCSKMGGKCSPAKFVFSILQRFATKLCDFTDLKVLFLSVMTDSFSYLDQNLLYRCMKKMNRSQRREAAQSMKSLKVVMV